jgi:hypothetical protein
MTTLVNRDVQSRVVNTVIELNGVKELLDHGINLTEVALRCCGLEPGYRAHVHDEKPVTVAVQNIRHLLSGDTTSVEIKHNIDVLRDYALDFKYGYFELCPTGLGREPLKMSDETLMGVPIGVVLLMICDILEQYYEFKVLSE